MNDALDQVMASCGDLSALDGLGREEVEVKLGQYLEKLSSAGHSDTEELAVFGLAYVRILRESPDPRYSGC